MPECLTLTLHGISDGSEFYWASRDGVLVAEYWKKVPQKRRLVAFEDGSSFELSPDEDVSPLEAVHGPVRGEREAVSHRVEHYLLTGAEVLEGPNEWAGRHIPIIPVIGDEIRLETECVRKSLIRAARDGQQLYNYWRSAAAEMIAMAPKSKWLLTAKHIAEYKNQWDTVASMLVRVTPRSGSKPRRRCWITRNQILPRCRSCAMFL